ncbi:MAG: type 4a pilus biogenesis protein PilO [bacterium]
MKKVRIFILIFPILLVGLSWLLFSPYITEIREVRQKIRMTRSRIERLRQLSGQAEDMDRKIALFQKNIQHLVRYLPGQGEIDSLLGEVRSKGTDYGLNMLKVDSDYSFWLGEADSSQDGAILCFEPVPVHLQAEGQLPDLCSYLEWLEGLPYFLGIDNVDIIRLEDSSSVFPQVRLTMFFKVMSLSHRGKEAAGRFFRKTDLYQPVHLSPSLIAAQKNLRITALEKDLFSPEGASAEEGEYQQGDGSPSGLEDVVVGEGDSEKAGGDSGAEERNSNPETDSGHRSEEAVTSIRDLDLNGIVSYQGEYIALINNRRLKKGETVIGMEVMWITKDSICLAKGSEKFILRLNQ